MSCRCQCCRIPRGYPDPFFDIDPETGLIIWPDRQGWHMRLACAAIGALIPLAVCAYAILEAVWTS